MKKNIMIFITTVAFISLSLGSYVTTNNVPVSDMVIEEELIVEEWMSKPFVTDDEVIEEELIIEDWMLKPLTWNGQ
jgi:hypothetical protein